MQLKPRLQLKKLKLPPPLKRQTLTTLLKRRQLLNLMLMPPSKLQRLKRQPL
jgi:hypothetical protein